MRLRGGPAQTAGGVWTIGTAGEVNHLLSTLWCTQGPVGLDLEYSYVEGRHVLDHARITCLTLGIPRGGALGYHPAGPPLHLRVFVPAFEDDSLVQMLKPWLESESPKVTHNGTHADGHVLLNHGIVAGGLIDTLVKCRMAYNGEMDQGLKARLKTELGYEVTDLDSITTRPGRLKPTVYKTTGYRKAPKSSPLFGTGILVLYGEGEVCNFSWSDKNREDIPHAELWRDYPGRRDAFVDYATLDAKGVAELNYLKDKQLIRLPAATGNNLDLCNTIWYPYCQLVAGMEVTGIPLSVAECERGAAEAAIDVAAYDAQLQPLAAINWNAQKQLAEVLFRQWNLPRPPIKGTVKTIESSKPDEWSTAEASLHWLELNCPERREALGWVRRYRKALKYQSYLTKLPKFMHADGRIHTRLAASTKTGRLAASDPPLQQMPNADSDKYGIRRAFVAGPGKSLIVADYSQLEVYLEAHYLLKLFNDDSLAQALLTGDVYGAVAKQCWPDALAGIDARDIKNHPDKAVKEHRKLSKIVVLAKNYCKTIEGMAISLLDETGQSVGRDYAKSLMDSIDRAFPGIPKLQDWLAKYAAKHGGVPTLLGRWRPIPECRSEREWERSAGARKAANTPIQGSAADVVACAGLGLQSSVRLARLGYRQVLHVHDEVILEGPTEAASEALALTEYTMEHPPGIELLVPLKVEAKAAPSWAEGK